MFESFICDCLQFLGPDPKDNIQGWLQKPVVNAVIVGLFHTRKTNVSLALYVWAPFIVWPFMLRVAHLIMMMASQPTPAGHVPPEIAGVPYDQGL